MILEVNNIMSQITHMASIKTIFQHCIEMNSISDKLKKNVYYMESHMCSTKLYLCLFVIYM